MPLYQRLEVIKLFNLVRNEFEKIFRKKTIYVIMIVMILLMLLIIFLNKNITMGSGFERHIEVYQEAVDEAEKNKLLDEKLFNEWVGQKDIALLKETLNKYDKDDWRYYIYLERLDENFVTTTNQLAIMEGKIRKAELNNQEEIAKKIRNSKEYIDIKEAYKKRVSDIDKMSESDYLNNQIKEKEAEVECLKKVAKKTEDTERMLKRNECELELLKYRKEKDIKYKNYYLNEYFKQYSGSKLRLIDMQEEQSLRNNNRDEAEQVYIMDTIKEDILINKYAIDNNQDIKSVNNAYILNKEFPENMGVFILVVISVYIAGTIVAEEFNKGTIKNLLIKPYTRGEILLAKLITVILMLILTSIFAQLIFLILSGLILGFETLSYSVPVYNMGSLKIYSLPEYAILMMLVKMPYVLMITLFAFAISTIIGNSAAAVTLGIMSYTALGITESILRVIYMSKKFTWIKYIPTLNWDWKYMLEPKANSFGGLIPGYSIAITIACILILLIPSFIVFKKKNIKNI